MGFLDNAGLAHVWAKVKTALSGKQDKLTGTAGQVVGFDAQGEAVAQDAPEGGITQEEADGRYLQLTGGTMSRNGYLRSEIMSVSGVAGAHPVIMLDGQVTESTSIMGTSYKTTARVKFASITDSHNPDSYTDTIIRGVAAPSGSGDAANKGYVDDAIAALNERIVALEVYLDS